MFSQNIMFFVFKKIKLFSIFFCCQMCICFLFFILENEKLLPNKSFISYGCFSVDSPIFIKACQIDFFNIKTSKIICFDINSILLKFLYYLDLNCKVFSLFSLWGHKYLEWIHYKWEELPFGCYPQNPKEVNRGENASNET